ncbi:MAG: hypothetical protein NVSMB23_21690 [Myxococcales bacterium]
MHGAHQDVAISSNPSGAQVTVDNQPKGITPVVANLSRGDSHIIKIDLPGYLPYETALTKSVSGWVVGNLLFGGLIGLGVDAISGGLYNLSPEQVQAEMRLGTQPAKVSSRDGDTVYILVTLKPDPKWILIARLERI